MSVGKRNFELSRDYGTFDAWWRANKTFAPHPDLLPRDGVVITVDENPMAMGFMYHTDSKVCEFRFFIVNPEVRRKERGDVINELLGSTKIWAKHYNYRVIFTDTNKRSFANKLRENGFVNGDDNNYHFFYEV